MKLSDLLFADMVIQGSIPDIEVTGLAMDSRKLEPELVFLAVQGVAGHGGRFVSQAIEKGASAVLWEPTAEQDAPELTIPLLEIADLSSYLGALFSRFYGEPSQQLNVIGVTGTDGKTSIVHCLGQCLKPDGVLTIGTLGYGAPDQLQRPSVMNTTPGADELQRLFAQALNEDCATVAMEVSSHALHQGRVAGVGFDIAVLSNISRDHLDYHGTLEAYAAAKQKLFRWPSLKQVVLNADDAWAKRWLAEGLKAEIWAYSKEGQPWPQAKNVCVKQMQFLSSGVRVSVDTPLGTAEYHLSLLGDFNVSNSLAVLSCLLILGKTLQQAVALLESLTAVPGRMQLSANGKQGFWVVDYAHTPKALESALNALRLHSEGRVICVFGCGGDRDQGKRPLMGKVAEQLADVVVLTDDNPRSEVPEHIFNEILQGMENPQAVIQEHDRRQALRLALELAEAGDLILVAGKGHEATQEIAGQYFAFSDTEVVQQLTLENTCLN